MSSDTTPSGSRSILTAALLVGSLLVAMLWLGVECLGAFATAPARGPASVAACLRPPEDSSQIWEADRRQRIAEARLAACREALRIESANPTVKVALAKAYGAVDQDDEEVRLLREAASQDDAEAHYQLFQEHKSFNRHLDRPVRVGRTEAERSLRAAAALGHRDAMHVLAVLLDRGTVVKRNPAEARFWAERLQANPPPDWGAVHVQVFWARLLVESEMPEDRVRGLVILEDLARSGHGDARGVLGIAIRNENPVRARALLEQALVSHPGRAIPPLAEMLIRGEGGPKDERRALILLQSDSTVPGISGALGQLYLEGRLVPRDVGRGIELVHHLAVWDHDVRLKLMNLLAAHPEVRIEHPDSLLYIAIEAADLDEPGALQALIGLKLSRSAQFADKPGGCALVAEAVRRGLPRAPQWQEQCRTN